MVQKEKESYSMGYEIGLSIKNGGLEADYAKLVQGMRDAIEGKKPRLSLDEMKTQVAALKKRAREYELRKIQEQIVRNAEESEKFLGANKKKTGIRTTESGLQYKILKEGDGNTPTPEDWVRVNYRGTFTDGKEFDSSYARGEPQTVQADGVIKGWTEALQMMKAGSKWQIFVPPHLAYGRGGLGQKIPPNTVLVFELELLSIEKEEKGGGDK
ncbi:MAG: FKBP-type peptidyl-prolyl cis-trans isomerase [Deltaproteobacteria bacterium]|nr:FKBP-type peptidyl-prolyl cis-trans isomerase [Deltaproteobacteria bacterium]